MDFPNCWFFAHTRHGSLVDEQLGNLQLPPTPKSWANLKKNKLHRVIQGKEFKLHRVIQGMLNQQITPLQQWPVAQAAEFKIES